MSVATSESGNKVIVFRSKRVQPARSNCDGVLLNLRSVLYLSRVAIASVVALSMTESEVPDRKIHDALLAVPPFALSFQNLHLFHSLDSQPSLAASAIPLAAAVAPFVTIPAVASCCIPFTYTSAAPEAIVAAAWMDARSPDVVIPSSPKCMAISL